MRRLLAACLLMPPVFAAAQQTYHQTADEAAYREARRLFNERAYAAAAEAFDRFLDRRNRGALAADASFKRALCALHLYQDDGLQQLRTHLREHAGYPGNRWAPYYAGRYFFRQGRYEPALQQFQQLQAERLPYDLYDSYHYMRGYSHLQNQQPAQARRWLKPLLEPPGDYRIPGRYFWAYAAMVDSSLDTALTVFRTLEGDPEYGKRTPLHITEIYYRQGHYDSVLTYGQQALQQSDLSGKARLRLLVGGAYYHRQAYVEAEPFLEEAQLPDSGWVYQKGITKLRLGRFEEAIRALEQLQVREDTLGQNITYHLGMAYAQLGNKLEAKNAYYYASLFDFDDALQSSAAFQYAKLTYETGFVQESLSAFQDYLKKYPRSADANEARSILGKLLLNSRNYAEALRVVEAIPQRDRSLNRIYQQLTFLNGVERFKNRDWDGAEDYLRRALRHPIDPVINAKVDFFLGETFYQTGDYQEGLAYYRDFLFDGYADQTPYQYDGYYGTAYCYYKVENYTKALTNFKLYLKETPKDRHSNRYYDVQARLADCHFAMRNYAEAIQRYEEVIEKGIREVDYALYQKGMIHGLQGQDDRKIATLKTLNQQFPQSPYLDDALYEIATLHFNAGDYGQAEREYQYIQQEFPNSPYARLALLQIGLIQYNKRQDDRALATLKRVIREYPNSREAREAEVPLRNIYTERGEADSLLAFLEQTGAAPTGGGYRDSVTYEAAYSFLKRDDCEQAIASFDRYLEAYPEGYFGLEAHYYRASCALRTGDSAQALVSYEIVAAAAPNQYLPKALEKIALIYYRRQAYPEARKNFARLQEVAQDNATLLFALIGRMRTANQMDDCSRARQLAREVLDQKNATDQDLTEAHMVSGQCAFQAGRYQEAQAQFDKVMELNQAERGAEAAFLKARALYQQKDLPAAREAVFSLRDRYGNYSYWVVSGFLLLSDIFVDEGNLFQAERTLESVVANYDGAKLRREAQQKLDAIRQMQSSNDTLTKP